MVQSRVILRRVLSCILCVCLLGTLTGCVGVTDKFRPDLNLSDGVRIFAEEGEEGGDPSVQPGATANVASSVWSGGSPNTGSFKYRNPTRDIDSSNFAETPAAMVEATDYGQYLREQVYQEVLHALEGLDADTMSKIYVRMGHTGYDYQNGKMRKVSGWSDTTAGRSVVTERVVGGDALIKLADDWLGDLSLNDEHRDSQINYAQSSINSYMSPEDFNKNWYELAGSRLPAIYYKMFGREGANFRDLQAYYDAIRNDPFNNLPNYNLYYYTGANSTNKMTFNKVNGNDVEHFIGGVPTETVDKLFGTYNQYINRDRPAVTNTVTDTSSILKYNIDGYNKTVIFIGTTAGTNLQELIGTTRYSNILKIISNAYVCTDVSQITSIKKNDYDDMGVVTHTYDYSGFTVIPAGTKGVD